MKNAALFYGLLVCVALSGRPALGQEQPTPDPQPLPPAGLLVITHVNVVDVVGEYVLEDRMVVVRDGCIESVGKHAPIGRAVLRLDGRGKFLIPGLWDGRTCALSTPSSVQVALPLYLANGITSIRDVSASRPRTELLAIVHAVESGLRPGPRIELAGAYLNGPWAPAVAAHRAGTQTEGRAQAEALLQEGWRVLAPTSTLPAAAYQGAAEVAGAWRLPLVNAVPEALSMPQALAAGHRGIEGSEKLLLSCSRREEELVSARALLLGSARTVKTLAACIAAQQPGIVASFDGARCTSLGQALVRQAVFVVPLLHSARISTASPPDMLHSSSPEENAQRQLGGVADSLRGRMIMEFQRLGVRLVAGSDEGITPHLLDYGSSLHQELNRLVAAGLTPSQALQAATVAPAIATGHRYDLGQILPDYHADLVLLDGNPLEDIRNLRRIRAVVLRGRVLNQDALEALAAEAAGRTQPAAARR